MSAPDRRGPIPMEDPARRLMKAHPSKRDLPASKLRRGVGKLLSRMAREGLLPWVRIMEGGHRFGRWLLRTEYVVSGACDQRGACCHHVLIEWSPWFERFPVLGRMVLWKLTRIYHFYDKGYSWEVQPGLVVRVLSCHALLPDGRCGDYRLRPLFCRTYPEVPLTGRPLLLKGCGYTFKKRDGSEIAESDLIQIGARRPRGAKTDP